MDFTWLRPNFFFPLIIARLLDRNAGFVGLGFFPSSENKMKKNPCERRSSAVQKGKKARAINDHLWQMAARPN